MLSFLASLDPVHTWRTGLTRSISARMHASIGQSLVPKRRSPLSAEAQRKSAFTIVVSPRIFRAKLSDALIGAELELVR